MKNPILKIVLTGEDYDLEMHEPEPGTIEIYLYRPDDEQSGGYIKLPTKFFVDALKKIISIDNL